MHLPSRSSANFYHAEIITDSSEIGEIPRFVECESRWCWHAPLILNSQVKFELRFNWLRKSEYRLLKVGSETVRGTVLARA